VREVTGPRHERQKWQGETVGPWIRSPVRSVPQSDRLNDSQDPVLFGRES
jgi:hypothetical protein